MRELEEVHCQEDYEKEKDVQKITGFAFIGKPLPCLEVINGNWGSITLITAEGKAPLLRDITSNYFTVFGNKTLPSLKYVDATLDIAGSLTAPHINYSKQKWYE